MKIIHERLDNGLNVIMVPMRGMMSINEVFEVRAGFRYENTEIYGISHLLEHMAFEGTEKRPTFLDFAKEVENEGGGTFNADAGAEETLYWCKLPSPSGKAVHDLLSDIVLNSKFDPLIIEKEKEVILRELYRTMDNPKKYLCKIMWPRLLYGDHPAAQSGYGTEASLRKLKRKDFLDYIKKLYVAPNSVLSVTGKIGSVNKTLKDINHYFQNLSSNQPDIKMIPVIERQRKPKILINERKLTQIYILLGVKTHPITIKHPDWAALKILTTILGGKIASRIINEIRIKRGWAYEVWSQDEFQTDTGNLATFAAVDPKRALETIKIILREYQRIASQGVSKRELRGTKNFLIGNFKLTFEDPLALADGLASEFLSSGKVIIPEERIKEFKLISKKDIQRVAKEIFRNEKLNLAVIGPLKDEEKLYDVLRF